jgi:DnaK suppressor protein
MKDFKEKRRDVVSIKDSLLTRKAQLEEEIATLQSEKYDDQTQDPADQASSAVFETLQNSLQHNELAEYKMIMKALEMIDQGIYGNCVDCEQPISERRLLSFPNASRCIGCQEKSEEALKHKDF